MISDGVLPVSSFSTHEDKEELTLMTLNSFSEPLTPLMLSLWSSWTISSKVRAERRHGEQEQATTSTTNTLFVLDCAELRRIS